MLARGSLVIARALCALGACGRGEAAPSNRWLLLLLSGRVVSRAGMDVLWAPWRMAYIGDRTPTGCIFCAACEGDPRERLLLGMSRASLVMLNRFPYQNAHLMIAPRRHTADLPGLPADEPVCRARRMLRPKNPSGYGPVRRRTAGREERGTCREENQETRPHLATSHSSAASSAARSDPLVSPT